MQLLLYFVSAVPGTPARTIAVSVECLDRVIPKEVRRAGFSGASLKDRRLVFLPGYFQLIWAVMSLATHPKWTQIPGNSTGAAWCLGPWRACPEKNEDPGLQSLLVRGARRGKAMHHGLPRNPDSAANIYDNTTLQYLLTSKLRR